MKIVLVLSLSLIVLQAKAWSAVRNPFEFAPVPLKIHHITDCMHVTTEEGQFIFKKSAKYETESETEVNSVQMVASPDLTVCGLYVIADPYKIVEITVKHMDVACESGGLMAFVDGWELNGEYYPSIKDHHLSIEDRVTEFCNEDHHWPFRNIKRTFKSSQNAALMQYRIPIRGSFIVTVKFLPNPDPCHIMVEGVVPFYVLKSSGKVRNCTVTAVFPAVVSLVELHIGKEKGPNYSCESSSNKLVIGGSSGLDSYNMERASEVCGNAEEIGPEQAIFCGVTTVRLQSSDQHSDSKALISIRQADENDLAAATLICQL